jgi:CO/xanthine dehydrogenase Mo-binding subunit
MNDYAVIGKRIPKIDAVDKATGRVKYIQDIELPGMLYGKILYSKYPHAVIDKIDTTRARALPGVRAVIVGTDVPEKMKLGFYKDNPPLKTGKVARIGMKLPRWPPWIRKPQKRPRLSSK